MKHFGLVPGDVNVKIVIQIGDIGDIVDFRNGSKKPVEVTLFSAIEKDGPEREQYVYKLPMYNVGHFDLEPGENEVKYNARHTVCLKFSSDSKEIIKVNCNELGFVVEMEGCPVSRFLLDYDDSKCGLIPEPITSLYELMDSRFITKPLDVISSEKCELTISSVALLMVIINDNNTVMCVM